MKCVNRFTTQFEAAHVIEFGRTNDNRMPRVNVHNPIKQRSNPLFISFPFFYFDKWIIFLVGFIVKETIKYDDNWWTLNTTWLSMWCLHVLHYLQLHINLVISLSMFQNSQTNPKRTFKEIQSNRWCAQFLSLLFHIVLVVDVIVMLLHSKCFNGNGSVPFVFLSNQINTFDVYPWSFILQVLLRKKKYCSNLPIDGVSRSQPLETNPGRARFPKRLWNPLTCHGRPSFPSNNKNIIGSLVSVAVLAVFLLR